jgi:hypothetical protein
VRAKQAKKPVKPVRYLLSADQKLRRLSLRKMSDRPKTAKSQPQSSRPKRPTGPGTGPQPKEAPGEWSGSTRAIGLAMTAMVAVVILIGAGVPSGIERVDKPASAPTTQPHAESEGTASGSQRTIALAPEPAATRNTSTTDRSTRTSPAVERIKPSAAGAATTPSRPRTDYRPTASRSKPATPESITTDAENAEVVTITGCLHLDQLTFTLKDVSGSEVPKSRRWRFGFFKKKPASSIDVIDAGNSLRLQNHVGERVAATGTLEDRKLRARSLRAVSGSCR